MKNISTALLAACILAGALISCGSDTTTTPNDSAPANDTTAAITADKNTAKVDPLGAIAV